MKIKKAKQLMNIAKSLDTKQIKIAGDMEIAQRIVEQEKRIKFLEKEVAELRRLMLDAFRMDAA